ncbi:MAG: hypothetical protein JO285_07300, partial [Kutzneria sp.]|nr:hypothetical protein [Kutzneria sp.]
MTDELVEEDTPVELVGLVELALGRPDAVTEPFVFCLEEPALPPTAGCPSVAVRCIPVTMNTPETTIATTTRAPMAN